MVYNHGWWLVSSGMCCIRENVKGFSLVRSIRQWLMEMERGIDPDALLDYVELQIFPSQNRYEAYVCSSNRTQKVASGTLKQLLLHSPRVKDLSSKGSNTNFKILPPDNSNDAEWFTTATLKRFLHIISSPDILSIGNEITQLEETRKFQLSLSVKAEVDITSSINSKNELLRAVDLRLTALKDELALAFDRATGARCSTKDISDLENFAHHFGAKDIRDSLQKFVEISIFPSPQDLININFNKNDRNAPAPPRKYSAFPTKAAQIERENSTDDENSSVSSENKQAYVERSRAPTRSSATPRRSASPMRRIQIGRSGSHRAAALTIKSLNYFPPREKLGFQRDAGSNSSEEEEEEEDPEKPKKNNVLRMSVQDKISLFESKQRDESVNIPKTKTLLNTNTKKGVLRRWSSGMGENATQHQHQHLHDNINNNTETTPVSTKNVAPETEVSAETAENITQVDSFEPEREESCEKHVDSIEWSQQKEAELNQLFTEMMENKPVKPRKLTNDVSKSKKSEQRGGFYDHYKQKRDEKLQRETAGKKAEKEAQLKVMQRFLDENNKLQKTQKNPIPLTNTRKESPKPSVLKKSTPKPPCPLPATRKSWPSPQPPKAKEASPSRTTSRKPQSTSSSDVRSSTKSEKSKPRSTTPKSTPDVVTNRNLKKTINEKKQKQKQPTVTKTTKSTKPTKVNNTPDTESKPSFYNKVTKKNSVVPLETKPFLRKGSGMKTKVADQPEEASRSSETLVIQSEENEVGMITDVTETVELEPQVVKLKSEEELELESESESVSPQRVEMSEQELVISPTAWVEVEVEAEAEEEIISSPVQTVSPVKAVKGSDGIGITSPRIRHSLSQMMLEDNSEEGDNGEWGNAEHPPALVYHKDSPKGFKRLLNPTKGRRSFFSLSTFRGSKTNESKGY
ncbi:unnamed protein product [Lactuca virosa]|uniref:COP1-interacting protein 7 n=1 Tax=Lactuca virosa TaxID=75947 RepID=A0AAU9N8L7_9ASTR|nr:unnamed protein product [Lactuca virosa]